MKEFLKRAAALGCALSLAASLTAYGYSDAMGEDVRNTETAVHQQTQLTKNVFWSSYFSDFRTENYVTYVPGGIVQPIVTYGSVLTERSTLSSTAKGLEAQGYRVVAGINGDFYNTDNGLPVGLIVTDGKLRSSDGGYWAMGFRRDGTCIMGRPRLSMRCDFGYQIEGTEVLRDVAAVNKAREDDGVYLFTYDFNENHHTGNTQQGYEALCTILDGDIAIGATVRARVESVTQTVRTTMRPNQFVLSVNGHSNDYWLKCMRNLKAGTELTVQVTAADAAWNDVVQGLGALYPLADNGRLLSGLLNDRAPRTAVGRRPDGTVIFYTLDGRRSGHSIGATMAQVANRLLELGCTTVLGLDGGGSTTITVTQPDERTAQTINLPSEGRERAVSNKIFLVAPGNPTGVLDHFYIKPDNHYVLAGSTVNLAVTAIDSHYYPTTGNYILSTTGGTLSGNTLTVPNWGGDVVVSASVPGGGTDTSVIDDDPWAVPVMPGQSATGELFGRTVIHVVSTPDSVEIMDNSGAAVSRLTVPPGTTVQMGASARWGHLPIYADAGSFRWSSEGTAGDVTEGGQFTAYTPGETTLTVSAGERTASIPVTVGRVGLRQLEDFEVPVPGDGLGVVFGPATGGELAKYGRTAGQMDYDLTAGSPARWTAAEPMGAVALPYDTLSLWVRGDGSGNLLSVIVQNGDGMETLYPLGTLNSTEWERRSAYLGRTGGSIAGFQVSAADGTGVLAGTVYVDQMISTYDNTVDDTPPAVTLSLDRSAWTARGTVRDGLDGILPAAAVSLSWNGSAVEGGYDEASGTVSWALPGPGDSQEPSRLTVTATDASGNIARASVDIPPSGTSDHFTDLAGCWAADYINYLYNQNIAQPDGRGRYRPYDNITRVEFAVMLARSAGLDGNLYGDVVLPYADIDDIPESAIPALKALWAENIMRGTDGDDGMKYLLPDNGLTRAQASAMIGRSQRLGFASGGLQRFPDADQIPLYARSHIQTMTARGILEGFQDGTFRPQANITRSQMAKILYFLA